VPTPPAGRVDATTIASLGLKVGDPFGYGFDFGDDWWHPVNVEGVEEKVPWGKFPEVTKRISESRRSTPMEMNRGRTVAIDQRLDAPVPQNRRRPPADRTGWDSAPGLSHQSVLRSPPRAAISRFRP
jgi:hypothetical protein